MLLAMDALFAVLSVASIAPLADILLDKPVAEWSGISLYYKRLAEESGRELTLFGAASLVWLALLVMAIVSVVVKWVGFRITLLLTNDLTGAFFNTLYLSNWEKISQMDRGKLVNTVIQEIYKVGMAFQHAASILVIVVRIAAFVSVPIFLAPGLVIVVITGGLIVLIPFLMLGTVSRKLGKLHLDAANQFVSAVGEAIDSVREVIAFAKSNQTINWIKQKHWRHIDSSCKSQIMVFGSSQFYEPVGFLVIVSVLIIGGGDSYPLSELGVLMWAMLRTIPPIKQMVGTKHHLDNVLPSLHQVQHLTFPQNRSDNQLVKDELTNMGLIKFDQVSFSYRNKAALQDVDLEIPMGKITAIVGESGAGKSTLIDLLLGLLEPDKGNIYVGEKNLSTIDLNSYRGLIGLVSQTPTLFDGSIRDNLLWAKPSATDMEIKRACEYAQASDFIEMLPDGFETTIGSRGARLSGGQSQRIALARAFLRQPKLIVLDEATSAIDGENEHSIYTELFDKPEDVTVLIIAHKINTLARADLIYVMRNGGVHGSGTYQKLRTEDTYFSRLVELQSV